MNGGQGVNGREGVIPGATALQQKVVTRGQQPHPAPSHPRAHAQTNTDAEDQAGQQQKRDEVQQKHDPIGFQKEQQRGNHPFHSAKGVIHPADRRMNPMPSSFRQPMQNPRDMVSHRGVSAGRIQCATEEHQQRQNGETKGKRTPKTAAKSLPSQAAVRHTAPDGFTAPPDESRRDAKKDHIASAVQLAQRG